VKGTVIWAILSLALFVAGAVLSVPKVADRVGLPMWLVFPLLFLDLVLVSAIPFTLREYVGAFTLNQRDPQVRFAYLFAGCAGLLIVGTVIVPTLAFVWVLIVILQ
jgi:hypothetical protein